MRTHMLRFLCVVIAFCAVLGGCAEPVGPGDPAGMTDVNKAAGIVKKATAGFTSYAPPVTQSLESGESAKIEVLLGAIRALPGFQETGVGVFAQAVPQTSSAREEEAKSPYSLVFYKKQASAVKTLRDVIFDETGLASSAQEAIAAAKIKVAGVDPIEKVPVTLGLAASLELKKTALKNYFLTLSGYRSIGVTTLVSAADENQTGNSSKWIVTLSKDGQSDAAEVSVLEFIEPPGDIADRESLAAAKDILETASNNFTSLNVVVQSGEAADAEAKTQALGKTVLALAGFPGTGAGVSADFAGALLWTVTLTKGNAKEVCAIGSVSFYDPFDPDVSDVARAKEKVLAGNPYSAINVSGGAGASLSNKKAAIKVRFLTLSGYATLAVNTALSPAEEGDTGNGSRWFVSFSKGAVQDTAAVTITSFIDTVALDADKAAVENARAILETAAAGFTEFRVSVSKGALAAFGAKTAALETALKGLAGFSETGVSLETEPGEGLEDWNVRISKGSATVCETIEKVTFYDPDAADYSAVAEAKAKIAAADPVGTVKVSGGAGAAASVKQSALKTYFMTLAGYVSLGVATTVVPEDAKVTGDGSRWVVGITKGVASDTITITVLQFAASP